MNNKKNIFSTLCTIFLIALCCFFITPAKNIEAATKKMADASGGKYTYYAQQGTIYSINNNTGVTKKIKKISDTNTITDISYYDGYLYFTVDYYFCLKGTDRSCTYVCRMKTNGNDFKKLGPGQSPVIYNKKIYYIQENTKLDPDFNNEEVVSEIVGIGRMSLKGSSKKTLIKNTDNINTLCILNDKIYYFNDNKTLFSANMKGNNSAKITSTNYGYFLGVDNNKLYFLDQDYNDEVVYQYTPSNKKIVSVLNYSASSKNTLGLYNGYIYYSIPEYNTAIYAYESATIYKMKVSNNKVSKIKKITTGSPYKMITPAGKWLILEQTYYKKGNIDENTAISKIRLTGKNYKVLEKYFRS